VRAATTSPVAWAAETVFYEVFVRSFADSDGDGIGDLDGLRLRLDYLADLGIRGLWLTPVFVAASYHGYDTVDHDHVDPVLGGDEALQRLLLAAHARGIRVLLDLVLNHTSAEHPWFVAARQGDPRWRNWYVWRDAAPVPTWTQPWGTAALIATSGLPPESRADSERLS
jgi:alpha-glucosidase